VWWFEYDSRVLFTALVGVVAAQRLLELALSARHRRALLARGGVEHGADHYRWMVLLHATFLPACVAEVWLLRRPLVLPLAVAAGALITIAMLVRFWTIDILGERWCTRVIVLSDVPAITTGPFRYLRHPNYLAVVVEIAAIPMVHTAWLTALVFSLLDAVMLTVRIRVEERALSATPGYHDALDPQPRWLPWLR
jgi:methyltransferase